jgi:hypothetical protein
VLPLLRNYKLIVSPFSKANNRRLHIRNEITIDRNRTSVIFFFFFWLFGSFLVRIVGLIALKFEKVSDVSSVKLKAGVMSSGYGGKGMVSIGFISLPSVVLVRGGCATC